MSLHRGLYEYGGKGARTPDLLDAIETLSQLSYAPDSRIIKVSECASPVKDKASGFNGSKNRRKVWLGACPSNRRDCNSAITRTGCCVISPSVVCRGGGTFCDIFGTLIIIEVV